VARERRLEPEWLDELAADEPRAMRSRRDLARLNAFMLQPAIMARSLIRYAGRKPASILDIGAGDGTFMRRVGRRLAPHWTNVTVILLDRFNIVSEQTRERFDALQWKLEIISEDVFRYLERATPLGVDIITANLFLHHFERESLTWMFARVAQSADLFVACDPRRNTLALAASHLVWGLGANDVTRHDTAASVRAGFTGRELSALWPNQGSWDVHEDAAGLFSHRFVAKRAVCPVMSMVQSSQPHVGRKPRGGWPRQ
jgi:Methyltransferase domain